MDRIDIHTMKALTIAALAYFCMPVTAQQPPLTYTLQTPEGAKPTARVDGTIAYDAASRQLFLFGGQDSSSRNDLWAYSAASGRWEELQPAGAKPPARFGHTLIVDPARRRLIVFGGQAGTGFFSDVWAYDLVQNNWGQVGQNDQGPSRRYGHSAIHDPVRNRMIVSHGFTSAGRFDDTWAFDLAKDTWQNLSPAGTKPVRRCLHHAVYDNANQQMLLYGGCASGFGPCPLGDLWSLDLVNNRWTELTGQPRPAPRQYYGTAFDTANERLILFGGSGGGSLNDTWAFESRGRVWRQLSVPGSPGARSRHQGAYAADRGTVYFFGGSTNTGLSDELWTLGVAAPPVSSARPELRSNGAVNAFSGAGGAVAPGALVSLYGANLGPADGVSFGFDALTGKLPVSGAGGVSVTWNGIAAPLLFARADQLNVQAPYELAGAEAAQVAVTVNGQTSEPVSVRLAAANPGLFPRVWNQDGTVNSAANPAAAGSVAIFYATGQGVTLPASATGAYPQGGVFPAPAAETVLRIGGVAAELLFRGQAPFSAGLMQINARVPDGAAAESRVTLKIGAAETELALPLYVRQ